MPERKETYVVWRRHPDGYVASSAGYLPRDSRHYSTAAGEMITDTFEELLVTDDWCAAHARIVAERVADEMMREIPQEEGEIPLVCRECGNVTCVYPCTAEGEES